MSQIQLVPRGLEKVEGNLVHMQREKGCLEIRQLVVRRMIKQAEILLDEADDIDEIERLEEIVETLYGLGSELETYRSYLEVELDKVIRGVQTLSGLVDQAGRQAFVNYMHEDTELSVQSLRQVRSYYDQAIYTLKEMTTCQDEL